MRRRRMTSSNDVTSTDFTSLSCAAVTNTGITAAAAATVTPTATDITTTARPVVLHLLALKRFQRNVLRRNSRYDE